MTDPTDAPASWRLRLSEGDRLEIRPTPSGAEPEIVLTMPAWRAGDLGTVLDRYNRLAGIFQESSDIWTEDGLVRGLRDASAAATGKPRTRPAPSRVGDAERGQAMVLLQNARPELTHEQLIAVVDAAAWWCDNQEDYKVLDLLAPVTTDKTSGAVYATLLGSMPADPRAEQPPRSAG